MAFLPVCPKTDWFGCLYADFPRKTMKNTAGLLHHLLLDTLTIAAIATNKFTRNGQRVPIPIPPRIGIS